MYIEPHISQAVLMYIDPGVGSIVIQVLVGMVVALPVVIKLYWQRFKGFFRRGK